MEKRFLTATDLMKYVYCPRIIYYMYVLKKPQAVTVKEERGIKKETEFQRKGKRTKIIKNYPRLSKLFKIPLESEKLGIRTIIDSIIIDEMKKEAYPIQAKDSFTPKSIYRTQKLQLVMESVLIEECLGYKSPHGFIKFLRSGELVKIDTESHRTELMETLQKLHETV